MDLEEIVRQGFSLGFLHDDVNQVVFSWGEVADFLCDDRTETTKTSMLNKKNDSLTSFSWPTLVYKLS